MQGLGNTAGTTENWGGCCSNNSALMAGLAYDANTRDIRPDLPNTSGSIGQTVQTFWLDVLEYQTYKANNQFYLAAKYGGFKAPANFDPYAATAALQNNWWYSTTDTVGSGNSAQPRPDNYFIASRPDQVIDGLTKAFASIASQIKAFTTSFSTALPQVSNSGSGSYSAQYDAQTWTGEITASTLTFSSTTGQPTTSENWRLSDKLEDMGPQAAGAGWNTGRRIVSWSFGRRLGRGLPRDRPEQHAERGAEHLVAQRRRFRRLPQLPARRPFAGKGQRHRHDQALPPAQQTARRHRRLESAPGRPAEHALLERGQPRLQQLQVDLVEPRGRSSTSARTTACCTQSMAR